MLRKFTVETNRVIPGLGITGPLTTPTKMEITNVLKMIRMGYKVYEHNVAYPSEKVLVTLKNISNVKFEKTYDTKKLEEKKEKERIALENSLKVTVQKKNENYKKRENTGRDVKEIKEESTPVKTMLEVDNFIK